MAVLNHLLSDRPELIAAGIYLLGLAITRWGARRQSLMLVLFRLLVFLVFTYSLDQANLVPYLPAKLPRDALTRFLGDGLKTIWWFWAAAIAAAALRIFLSRGSSLSKHRFAQDLAVAGIYLCALIGFVSFILNLPLQGLLVTSGAVAVILGLALQSTLGDVFYGIVLNLGKPYHVGDWITLDAGGEGTVIEMNWRATNLLTQSQDVVIVPNSIIAKAKITNASYPSRVHGTDIKIPLAPTTSPLLASQILADAALGCQKVLLQPPPTVVVQAMSREAILFQLTFFTPEVGLSAETQNQIYEKIFRCLGVAGIGLGTRTGMIQNAAADTAVATSEAQRLAAFTPVFNHLPADERMTIASAFTREVFEPNDTIIAQGDVSPAMFVIASGVVTVTRKTGEQDSELGRLSAADHFGAGGLLGGSPVIGRVAALTRVVVYRLAKADLAKLAEARPGFADDLSHELAARRQLGNSAVEAQETKASSETTLSDWFARHLRRAWQPASANDETG